MRHTESDNKSSPIGTPDIAGNPENVSSSSGKAYANTGENVTCSTDSIKNADKEEASAFRNPSTGGPNESHPPEDSGFDDQIGPAEEASSYFSSKLPEGGNDDTENSRSSANDPNKEMKAKWNSANRSLSTTRTNPSFNSINFLNSKRTDSGSFSLEGINNNNVTWGVKLKKSIHCCPDIKQLQLEKIELETQFQAKILEVDEEINTLRQINSNYIEQINELQQKTSDAEATKQKFTKVIEESNIIFDALTDDLKKKKSSTWTSLLSWFFTNRNKTKCDEYNVINKIASVCNTLKSFDTKFNQQQQIIEKQQSENEKLNKELQGAHDKCKRTEENFNKKLVKQTDILQKRDDELEHTKREHQKEITSLKETINELNSNVKREKETSEIRNNTLTSKLKELRGANCEILSLKKGNSNLEQRLEQNEYQLKRLWEKKSDLDLQVYQTKEEVEKFKQKLNDAKFFVKKQVSVLKMQEEKFQNYLENISDKMKNHQKIISLEDNAEQAEKHVINNALARIRKVKEEVKNSEDQIYAFSGNSENRTFLTLKEILVRAVTKLDRVESESKAQILSERKECIVYVTELLNELESRVGK